MTSIRQRRQRREYGRLSCRVHHWLMVEVSGEMRLCAYAKITIQAVAVHNTPNEHGDGRGSSIGSTATPPISRRISIQL